MRQVRNPKMHVRREELGIKHSCLSETLISSYVMSYDVVETSTAARILWGLLRTIRYGILQLTMPCRKEVHQVAMSQRTKPDFAIPTHTTCTTDAI